VTTQLDDLPGFRRRILISPQPGRVSAYVEDDYHCMGVTLHHANGIATKVEPDMIRVPWTTCPGAPAVLEKTFTGLALDAFAKRGEKFSNCTHLHDMALLAAAHANDAAPLTYDILVSDPVEGRSTAELRRNGVVVLDWVQAEGKFVEPAHLAGKRIDELGPWIASLDAEGQEYARIFRWATMIAHGRLMTNEIRSGMARKGVGQCFTFQPETAATTVYRPETVQDFSHGQTPPLAAHHVD
jgi:hypothetical protein